MSNTIEVKIPELRDWYVRPMYKGFIIVGKIYGDFKKRFEDGTEVCTSKVLQADFEKGLVITCNSVYCLK